MLSQRSLFVLVSCAAALPAAHAQGESGFLRGKGNLDLSLSYDLDTYDRFWVGDTKVNMDGVGRIKRHAVSLYGAYGLTDGLDVVATGAYVDVTSDGDADFPDEDGLQDATVYLKWRAIEGDVPGGQASLLLTPGIKFPLSSYEDNAVTAIGDGQIDWRARAIAHYQHYTGTWFSLEGGYDIRNGDPKNDTILNATLGIPVGKSFTLMPFYSQVWSAGGIDISDVPAKGPFPAVQEEYQRIGVRAYWEITEHFGLSAGWRDTLDGKNTGDVESFSGGVVWRVTRWGAGR